MPKQARRRRTPGPPRFAQRFQFGRRRPHGQPFDFLGRDQQAQIADGPDIRSPQRHQQINIHRPIADAFEPFERGADGGVFLFVQAVQIKFAFEQGPGERANVLRLLAAETDGFERDVVQREKGFRLNADERGLQAIKGGFGRSERDLLFEDDMNQRGKTRFTRPERRRAETGDNRGQIGIARRQGFDGAAQTFFIERFERQH